MAESATSRDDERRATARRSLSVVVSTALLCVVVDQAIKGWALTALADGRPVDVLGDLVQLRLVTNAGAAFSMGEGVTWLFTLLGLAITGVVLWAASGLRSREMRLLFGMFLGGVLGNLVDRLVREPGFGRGHVIDWLQVRGFAVMNLADILLTVSVVGLVVVMLLRPREIDEVTHEHEGEGPEEGAPHAQ